MSRPGDGDFLCRWSARKLKARAEPPPKHASEPAPAEAQPAKPEPADQPSEAVPEKSDAELLEELGLPDPDSLVKGDDFQAFMRAGVPGGLRKRALRRLWLSDPVLANLDGLNDYDQDYTDAATVKPNLKTAYRVGKGFLRDEPEAASAPAPAAAEPAAEGAAPGEGGAPDGTADGGPDRATRADAPTEGPAARAGTDQVDEIAGAAPGGDASPDGLEATPRPPRMRFRFDAG